MDWRKTETKLKRKIEKRLKIKTQNAKQNIFLLTTTCGSSLPCEEKAFIYRTN